MSSLSGSSHSAAGAVWRRFCLSASAVGSVPVRTSSGCQRPAPSAPSTGCPGPHLRASISHHAQDAADLAGLPAAENGHEASHNLQVMMSWGGREAGPLAPQISSGDVTTSPLLLSCAFHTSCQFVLIPLAAAAAAAGAASSSAFADVGLSDVAGWMPLWVSFFSGWLQTHKIRHLLFAHQSPGGVDPWWC
jgi:hypothetical protein